MKESSYSTTFPSPSGTGIVQWDGGKFLSPYEGLVLCYPMPNEPTGWTDDLTDFHEEVSKGEHPIDKASFALALGNIKQGFTKVTLPKKESQARVCQLLEIGCSSGFLLRRIHKFFPEITLVGADIINVPLQRLANDLRQEGNPVPLLQFDLTSCPLPDESQDIVITLNVLEHIEDDQRALKEIYRILRPNGIFIFEVPAGKTLYDQYDKDMHHYRRYSAKELKKLLLEVGFEIERFSHLGFFLFPFFYVTKFLRSRITSKSETKKEPDKPSGFSQKLITMTSGVIFKVLFQFEIFCGRYTSYPLGIRCFGRCKK